MKIARFCSISRLQLSHSEHVRRGRLELLFHGLRVGDWLCWGASLLASSNLHQTSVVVGQVKIFFTFIFIFFFSLNFYVTKIIVNISLRYLESFEDNLLRQFDFFDVIRQLSFNPLGREIAWDYVRINKDKLIEKYSYEDIRIGQMILDITDTFENEFLYGEVLFTLSFYWLLFNIWIQFNSILFPNLKAHSIHHKHAAERFKRGLLPSARSSHGQRCLAQRQPRGHQRCLLGREIVSDEPCNQTSIAQIVEWLIEARAEGGSWQTHQTICWVKES